MRFVEHWNQKEVNLKRFHGSVKPKKIKAFLIDYQI